jgi:hypothetical protein
LNEARNLSFPRWPPAGIGLDIDFSRVEWIAVSSESTGTGLARLFEGKPFKSDWGFAMILKVEG